MGKVIFVYDKIFLEHETGAHPENKNRLIAINEKLTNSELSDVIELTEPVRATNEDIIRIHTEDYINFVAKEIEFYTHISIRNNIITSNFVII